MPSEILKNRYKVGRLVSEDLVSFIYLGRHTTTDEAILIWKYKDRYLNEERVQDFLKKADTLHHFDHPQLLSLIDYTYDGANFFVIYKHPEKLTSLENALSKSTDLTLKQLWRIATQLLSAMLYIEHKGLTHGNLNFSHLYLDKKQNLHVTCSYFHGQILHEIIDDLVVLDSAIFTAPELIQHKTLDIRSDIYAFGIVLYKFFSNAYPYIVVSKIDDLKKEWLKPIKPFKKRHDNIPDKLVKIIYKCLAKDPSARFASFAELATLYKSSEVETISVQDAVNANRIQDEIRQGIEKEEKRKLWSRVRLYLLTGAAVFSLLLSYTIYNHYVTEIPEISIPRLTGLSIAEAEAELSRLGLTYKLGGRRLHDEVDADKIIESRPPAGRIVKKNRLIYLYLSKGREQYRMPNLIGRTVAQSKAILLSRADRLTVLDEDYSNRYERGMIIEQLPTPNLMLGPTENIDVIVSMGYPVSMNVRPASAADMPGLRRVYVTFMILEDWDPQEVSIFYSYKGSAEKVYSDLHNPHGEVELIFELEIGGQVEVFFDEELALRDVIRDPKPVRTVAPPPDTATPDGQ